MLMRIKLTVCRTVRRLLTSPTLLFLLSTDFSFSRGDGVGLLDDQGDGPFDSLFDEVFLA